MSEELRERALRAYIDARWSGDQAGLKAGDVILAINDHYLFRVRELQEEPRRVAVLLYETHKYFVGKLQQTI